MDAITTHLGIGSYRESAEEQHQECLVSELRGKRPLLGPDLPQSDEVADVLARSGSSLSSPPTAGERANEHRQPTVEVQARRLASSRWAPSHGSSRGRRRCSTTPCGWELGFGAAFRHAAGTPGSLATVREMYDQWPFFRVIIDLLEMVFARVTPASPRSTTSSWSPATCRRSASS